MFYTSCYSFFARVAVLLYSKFERDPYVPESARDSLFYTDSSSDLLARFSQHRIGHVRSTMHRRPLAIICCSVSKIGVTRARQCVRPDPQARLFTPVILSAAKDQRGEAEAPSLSRGILQHHGSNRSSLYATSVVSLRGDSRFAAALNPSASLRVNSVKGLGITSSFACGSGRRKRSAASATFGMTEKGSRELERH
jgi:hypothetical protein